MTVSILVPTGGLACEWRDRARRWVIGHYAVEFPGWELIVATSGEPWAKGRAVHDAYRRSSGSVLVIADADSFVAPQALRAAVAGAVDPTWNGWAMPHGMVHRLNQQATEAVYAGQPPDPRKLARPAYHGVKGGGIVAIRREIYELVGGIDPRFEGWGGEDVSLAMALMKLTGRPWRRSMADLWHLWHPHPAPDLRGSVESEALVARYKAAVTPTQMALLVEEVRREHLASLEPVVPGDADLADRYS